MPFVVESPALNAAGERVGTFRLYVATDARAREVVALCPDERTYREIRADELPAKVPVPKES